METAAQHPPEDVGDVLRVGNMALNLNNYRVAIDDRVIALSYHEFELLRLFAGQPDRVVAYRTLAESLWGAVDRGAIRRLNVLVHRLRSKLSGSRDYAIETVRGRGYGLVRVRD